MSQCCIMFWSHALIGELYDCGLWIAVINPALLALLTETLIRVLDAYFWRTLRIVVVLIS